MGQGKDTMKRSRRAATEAEKAFKAAEKLKTYNIVLLF